MHERLLTAQPRRTEEECDIREADMPGQSDTGNLNRVDVQIQWSVRIPMRDGAWLLDLSAVGQSASEEPACARQGSTPTSPLIG